MVTEDLLRIAVQRYCVSIARDRLLVQAAGGNVSWKSGDTLWIKASGTWLADAEHKDIFVPVDLRLINAALKQSNYAIDSQAFAGCAMRPSIETMLHALMPHQFVLHLHPVDTVVHLSRGNCLADLDSALSDTFAWELVEYYKPGAELAQAVHEKLRANPNIRVVLLKNHGVIVSADTIEEMDGYLKILTQRLYQQPRPLDDAGYWTHGFTAALQGTPYQVCLDVELQCLATDFELYNRLGDSWAICPDHVVFLGAQAIRIDDLEALLDSLMKVDPVTPFLFVKGVGVLENRAVTQAQKMQMYFYRDVMARQPVGQLLEPLSQGDVANLLNWDAEKYRITLSKSAA